jgi:hypothetical protein
VTLIPKLSEPIRQAVDMLKGQKSLTTALLVERQTGKAHRHGLHDRWGADPDSNVCCVRLSLQSWSTTLPFAIKPDIFFVLEFRL